MGDKTTMRETINSKESAHSLEEYRLETMEMFYVDAYDLH
jgi:hypothetical protein